VLETTTSNKYIEAGIGEIVRVNYEVSGDGYPAAGVGVSLLVQGYPLLSTSPASHFYPVISGGRHNFFSLVGLSEGVYQVTIDTLGQTTAARPTSLTLKIVSD
jgi:hypothetical protein